MKRELGIAKCGHARCLCSENTTCGGCDAGDCPVPPRPKNLPVTRYLCLLDFFRQVIIIKNVIFGNEVLPRRCRNRFYELMTSAFTQKSFFMSSRLFLRKCRISRLFTSNPAGRNNPGSFTVFIG